MRDAVTEFARAAALLWEDDATTGKARGGRGTIGTRGTRTPLEGPGGGVYGPAALARLYQRLEPALLRSVRPEAAAPPPDMRAQLQAYIDAQPCTEARAAVRGVVRNRAWRYVPLTEFVATLAGLAVGALPRALGPAGREPVLVAIDSLAKSSFWVLLLVYRALAGSPRRTAAAALLPRLHLAVCADYVETRAALRAMPPNTRLLLVDDAAYSALQLRRLYDDVYGAWMDVHNGVAPAAAPVVLLPFISTFARERFRLARARVVAGETFRTLFHRRSLEHVLRDDVFFRFARGGAFQSYLFHVLMLDAPHGTLMFEHKTPDWVSIPYVWLHAGPCFPAELRTAYRLDARRLPALVRALRAEDAAEVRGSWRRWRGADGDDPDAWARLDVRRAAERVCALMQSKRFRSQFATLVTLHRASGADAAPPPPRFLPLMPADFCCEAYRRYAARVLDAASGRVSSTALYGFPECQDNPYRRPSFRRALLDTQ